MEEHNGFDEMKATVDKIIDGELDGCLNYVRSIEEWISEEHCEKIKKILHDVCPELEISGMDLDELSLGVYIPSDEDDARDNSFHFWYSISDDNTISLRCNIHGTTETPGWVKDIIDGKLPWTVQVIEIIRQCHAKIKKYSVISMQLTRCRTIINEQ